MTTSRKKYWVLMYIPEADSSVAPEHAEKGPEPCHDQVHKTKRAAENALKNWRRNYRPEDKFYQVVDVLMTDEEKEEVLEWSQEPM